MCDRPTAFNFQLSAHQSQTQTPPPRSRSVERGPFCKSTARRAASALSPSAFKETSGGGESKAYGVHVFAFTRCWHLVLALVNTSIDWLGL
eukprot:scaffold148388_cov28-Tisochrysis_lutea.AAC.1